MCYFRCRCQENMGRRVVVFLERGACGGVQEISIAYYTQFLFTIQLENPHGETALRRTPLGRIHQLGPPLVDIDDITGQMAGYITCLHVTVPLVTCHYIRLLLVSLLKSWLQTGPLSYAVAVTGNTSPRLIILYAKGLGLG